jgi:hypothetical protein
MTPSSRRLIGGGGGDAKQWLISLLQKNLTSVCVQENSCINLT